MIPTSYYGSGGNYALDLCGGVRCLGAALTNTFFDSLPADADNDCTNVDGVTFQCDDYGDPQMLRYRYLFLDAGFMPGSPLVLKPICAIESSTAYYAGYGISATGWTDVNENPVPAPVGCLNTIPDLSTLEIGTEFDCLQSCVSAAHSATRSTA